MNLLSVMTKEYKDEEDFKMQILNSLKYLSTQKVPTFKNSQSLRVCPERKHNFILDKKKPYFS